MKDQRIMGILLILICVGIIFLAAQGTTPEEKDVTAVLFLLPLGIYALVTKERILYDSQAESTQKENASYGNH